MKRTETGSLRSVLVNMAQSASLPLTAFVWAASCIVCVLAGPFGTYEAMSVGARALYWTTLVSIGVVLGFVCFSVSIWYLGREKTPIFPVLAAALMTMSFGPVAISLRSAFAANIPALEVYPVSMAIHTFLITAAVFTFRQFLPGEAADVLFDQGRQTEQPDLIPDMTPEPRLLRRLPDAAKGSVLYLSANDHHVEVVTDAGRHELRMRLVDAIDEMEPVEGMCVHRSYWVARAAIAQVERINAHKTQVHLITGDTLPVSRKYKVNLDEAGLTEMSIAAS